MRILWGVVLIVLGTLMALQTFGVLPVAVPFWPTVWTILGVYLIVQSLRPRSPRWSPAWVKLSFGVWFAAVGIADILHANALTTMTGGDVWRMGWFVLLIGAGLALVFGDGRWKWYRWSKSKNARVHYGVGDLYFGREPWVLERDFEVTHRVGDVRVDLTTAQIGEGTHRVYVNAGIGEVVVLVPDDCNVRAHGTAGIGEVEVFGDERAGMSVTLEKSVDVPDAASTLEIFARLGIGSVSIRRVPSRR